ncbi:hypothetical protein DMP15_01825 [Pseudonocardia sp. UM4_GMWB1]
MSREGGQVRAAEAGRRGSVGHVEVFRMDGVGTSIVGRPRRLSADRRARPTYTLIWEEPVKFAPQRTRRGVGPLVVVGLSVRRFKSAGPRWGRSSPAERLRSWLQLPTFISVDRWESAPVYLDPGRGRSGPNYGVPSLKAGVRKDRGFESPRFRHRSQS